MAQVQASKPQVECGQGLYDFIIPKLYRAQRLIIVSPWLSPETARLIIHLVSHGVKIHLITTGDFTNRSHATAMRLLGTSQGSRSAILATGILLTIKHRLHCTITTGPSPTGTRSVAIVQGLEGYLKAGSCQPHDKGNQ
jgi:fructose-1,6-bisphosphatase/sedoheptulose 1,7-bisphosphatase-like protein